MKSEVNAETKKLFQGESTSSVAGDQRSLLARCGQMITDLKADPLSFTERHTKGKKRKRGTSSWSRQFQRNLVVIDFQGHDQDIQPYCSLRDYEKVYEGAIILYGSMTEDDVRREIVSLVRCKKSLFHSFDDLNEQDIEFVKCANRRVRVPDGNVVCDGNGIKNRYRSGAVYVRLTRSFEKVHYY